MDQRENKLVYAIQIFISGEEYIPFQNICISQEHSLYRIFAYLKNTPFTEYLHISRTIPLQNICISQEHSLYRIFAYPKNTPFTEYLHISRTIP